MDRHIDRNYLHIGRIIGAHGLSGELKVWPLTDDLSRFARLRECLIETPDEKNAQPAQAAGARLTREHVLLRLQGISDRTAAETLKGHWISVTREHAITLPPDTWFVCDLIGCQVFDTEHGYLGHLTDVLPTAAHDVYTVSLPPAKDLLFPALKTILLSVDVIAKHIDVKLPNGLYEIYRDTSTGAPATDR